MTKGMGRKKGTKTTPLQAPLGEFDANVVMFGEEAVASAGNYYSRRESVDPIANPCPNLMNFAAPFTSTGAEIDCRDAVKLCLKAYWAFPLLRNIVEVMGELSNSRLFLKGGSKKVRDFISAWFEKINLWQLKEQFFREWFRSGNCFFYRFDGDFKAEDLRQMTQVYGNEALAAKDKKSIPYKYIILNPETITAGGNISFNEAVYFKVLNQYELQHLKNPKTKEDKDFLKSLDEETRKSIKSGGQVKLKLDPEKLSVLLYKAQGYEPMGVPMAYGVLNDIEAKLELKRIDLSIARTTDRALLMITVGSEPSEHNPAPNNINRTTIAALQQAFSNESISRTLITDYTVKGNWLIPDVNKILGQEKYAQLDKDINVGLNAVLFSEGEKFANTSIKVQIFVERLKEARNAFLKNFLQKEVVKICQTIGAKNYPEVHFEDLSLKDEIAWLKIVVQLAQFGFLTPEEMFEAMDSGKLPTVEDSIDSQRAFKALRGEELYMPIMGSSTELQKQQVGVQKEQLEVQKKQNADNHEIAKQQVEVSKVKAAAPPAKPKQVVGRPTGTGGPKAATKPTPMGSKANDPETGYSLSKLHSFVPKVSNLHNKVDSSLKKHFKLKKLTEEQGRFASLIVSSIISNEKEEDWAAKIPEYVKQPKDICQASLTEIEDIQLKHNIDEYLASILRLAQTEAPKE